jgi:reversibly glycosylated polypeptide/UDP-arabinopyranose mutase
MQAYKKVRFCTTSKKLEFCGVPLLLKNSSVFSVLLHFVVQTAIFGKRTKKTETEWKMTMLTFLVNLVGCLYFGGSFARAAMSRERNLRHNFSYGGVDDDAGHQKNKNLALEQRFFDENSNIRTHPQTTLLTTNPSVPQLFKQFLSNYGEIDESLSTSMPAAKAVDKVESIVGWDATTSSFVDSTLLKPLMREGLSPPIEGLHEIRHKTIHHSSLPINHNSRPMYDMMDIVIPSIRDLDFLEDWKPFIEDFHLIIIQDGDPSKLLKIPDWADYELYNRDDINKALGDNSWIISSKDASIRNFGFLVSEKEFIYTLDDDCLPAINPYDATTGSSHKVNAIKEHMKNLLTNSTPHFFNTVYDPFHPGVDFVRGYPYSLRQGVTTVISHGLWMNAYDYDAPTQLLKVNERNTRYIDMTQTIPKGVLYPMCSMNVAFNKKIIGPAFMQGLMGEGQPWARYDDMFAGWTSKVIADHLNLGVKSGAPYIHHNKASNPFTNLKKEYMGLFWQEDIIQFMSNVKLSPSSNTAAKAYLELSDQINQHLSHLNPYFTRLAKAMKLWIDVWEARFGGELGEYDCYAAEDHQRNEKNEKCIPTILPIASRSNIAPKTEEIKASTCAIFTIVHNEGIMLPIWLRYYLKNVDAEHLWILDHNTHDGSTSPDKIPPGVHVRKLYGEAAWMPHHFINRQVELQQQRLFRAGYRCVLFTEVDEIIVPDPLKYPGGLKDLFRQYLTEGTDLYQKPVVNMNGYHIVHAFQQEPEIDYTKSILQQRAYWRADWLFCKPLLAKVPLRYTVGHHTAFVRGRGEIDAYRGEEGIYLVHLHSLDHHFCVSREKDKYNGSLHHRKPGEDAFGMNAHVKLSFDEIVSSIYVCGLTMFRQEGEDMKTPTGEIAVKIPDTLKTIEI